MTLMGFSHVFYLVFRKGRIVGTPTRQFVQILHTGGNHWVTASNLFAENNEVLHLWQPLNNVGQQYWTGLIMDVKAKGTPICGHVSYCSAATVACLQLDLHMHYAATLAWELSVPWGSDEGRLLKCFRTGKIEFKIEAKLRNIAYLQNDAVKWFDMRCACSMGCPV